jgi:hypothetical protein
MGAKVRQNRDKRQRRSSSPAPKRYNFPVNRIENWQCACCGSNVMCPLKELLYEGAPPVEFCQLTATGTRNPRN